MSNHPVADPATWLAERKALLAKEKQFTKLYDELVAQRRGLPWKAVEKDYVLRDSTGPVSLKNLFDGRPQLIVYHFMFDPSWDEGCKSCSLAADHFDRSVVHLHARDTALAVVSRAPVEKIGPFRQRMGWSFRWVSSAGSDFNRDFGVTFSDEETAAGNTQYNYGTGGFPVQEAPGISVFALRDGATFHTYSSYGRGLEPLLGVYHLLDLTPQGRDEDALPYPMAWVRHHDKYDDATFADRFVSAIAPANTH